MSCGAGGCGGFGADGICDICGGYVGTENLRWGMCGACFEKADKLTLYQQGALHDDEGAIPDEILPQDDVLRCRAFGLIEDAICAVSSIEKIDEHEKDIENALDDIQRKIEEVLKR